MTGQTCPNCNRPAKQLVRGWCRRCYNAWIQRRQRGTATDEPPLPPVNRASKEFADRARRARQAQTAERRAAYCELRADGHPISVAAVLVGVQESTAERDYEPVYLAQQGAT